jgi:hypothetical protein
MKAKQIITVLAFLTVLLSVRTNAQFNNYTWESLKGVSNYEGVNGNVYAITTYQGKTVVAGNFTEACGVTAKNIAMWDRATNSWSDFGNNLGINPGDTIRALAVYNGELYAGGLFSTSSGAQNLARWTGTDWVAVGTNPDGEVDALMVYNSTLVAGGEFGNIGNRIASWNGSSWSQIGGGFNTNNGAKIFALTIYNTYLVAAGRCNTAGGNNASNIAMWNGSVWAGLSLNTDERIFALAVHNGQLFAGGRFTFIGGVTAYYIARYISGTTWAPLAGGNLDNRVYAIASYSPTYLIVGGQFKYAGSLYVNYVALWNGTSWFRMLTGMDEKVEALLKIDSTMYAGGEFTIAGGKRTHHIARWFNNIADTIQGTVKYSDNNASVDSGWAYSVRRDYFTNEVIKVDSARIGGGTYKLIRPPVNDTLRVIWFPDDELDFVPTYYPSTIDWRNAATVIPGQNTNNINGLVYRLTPAPQSSPAAHVHGTIHLNVIIPLDPPGAYPYRSESVLYVKQGNTFNRFAVSITNENYSITAPMAPGSYELVAYRLGYCLATTNITINTNTADTIVNFTLDTCGPIGINTISTEVPKEYRLMQNYPNPFNPVTNIRFAMPESGNAKLTVFDIMGREIAVLVNGQLSAGTYNYDWNASNLASGVYFYRLEVSTESALLKLSETKKMVLIK